jgi:lysine-N-methylase
MMPVQASCRKSDSGYTYLCRLIVKPVGERLMMSQPAVRAPRYLERFRCLGPACEDHCCAGWLGLDVDRATFERYQQVDHLELGPKLRGLVVRSESGPSEETDYAEIDLPPGECCPFFSAERLCQIQTTLGEALLPVHCDAYPRHANLVHGQVDLAARLSCPEAARLALLAPDALEPIELEADRRLAERGRDWTEEPWLNRPAPHEPRFHYQSLRARCLELLQARQAPLAARLRALGRALEYLGERPLLEPPDLVRAFAEAEPLLTEPPGPASFDLQEPLLRRLRAWVAMRGVPARYRVVLDRLQLGLALPADPAAALGPETRAAYEQARQRWARYVASRAWLLENYLANHIWLSSFPFQPPGSFFDAYTRLICRYAIVRLHLIGAAGSVDEVGNDLVIETIQAFEKYADTPDYWQRVLRVAGNLSADGLAALVAS